MTRIILSKRFSKVTESLTSYRLSVEATSSEDIVKSIFIKQRSRNPITNQIEDTFVAVATPAQLEDIPENAPPQNSSFFRTNQIDLVAETPEYLDSVFKDILAEVQKLIADSDAMNQLDVSETYEVTANAVTIQ